MRLTQTVKLSLLVLRSPALDYNDVVHLHAPPCIPLSLITLSSKWSDVYL